MADRAVHGKRRWAIERVAGWVAQDEQQWLGRCVLSGIRPEDLDAQAGFAVARELILRELRERHSGDEHTDREFLDEQIWKEPERPTLLRDEDYPDDVARPYVPEDAEQERARQMQQMANVMDGFGEVVTDS